MCEMAAHARPHTNPMTCQTCTFLAHAPPWTCTVAAEALQEGVAAWQADQRRQRRRSTRPFRSCSRTATRPWRQRRGREWPWPQACAATTSPLPPPSMRPRSRPPRWRPPTSARSSTESRCAGRTWLPGSRSALGTCPARRVRPRSPRPAAGALRWAGRPGSLDENPP